MLILFFIFSYFLANDVKVIINLVVFNIKIKLYFDELKFIIDSFNY